jgi:23S rRNA pseudouridine2605 synthase
VLALAGYGSRRACEQLILDGRVEVDREIAAELGIRVDVDSSEVRVDGERIKIPRQHHYMLNKPPGVVTTKRDPARRPRVIDLIPGGEQLFTVGRLDMHSSGLIIVTNDGDLANRLAHPRYGIAKTYRVVVEGQPTRAALDKMQKGVHLAEGHVRVASVRVKSRQKRSTVLQIVLNEGRNREIRRMLAQVGHKVQSLERTAIGPLRLGDLPVGAHRPLTQQELRSLRAATKQGPRRPRKGGPGSSERSRTSPASAKQQRSTGKQLSSKRPGKRRGKKAATPRA